MADRGRDGKFLPGNEAGCKLTPEMAAGLVAGVKTGLFDAQNALKHGIDVTTLKSWVDRGLDEESAEPYKSFAEAYLKASIAHEEQVIATVLAAADEYVRQLESEEEFEGNGDGGGSGRKTKKGTETKRGDWKAAAWYAERRWPLRWGLTRQPEGGPKEAIKLPDAPMNRRRKVNDMVKSPPPELIKAFREAGYEVRKIPT